MSLVDVVLWKVAQFRQFSVRPNQRPTPYILPLLAHSYDAWRITGYSWWCNQRFDHDLISEFSERRYLARDQTSGGGGNIWTTFALTQKDFFTNSAMSLEMEHTDPEKRGLRHLWPRCQVAVVIKRLPLISKWDDWVVNQDNLEAMMAMLAMSKRPSKRRRRTSTQWEPERGPF